MHIWAIIYNSWSLVYANKKIWFYLIFFWRIQIQIYSGGQKRVNTNTNLLLLKKKRANMNICGWKKRANTNTNTNTNIKTGIC